MLSARNCARVAMWQRPVTKGECRLITGRAGGIRCQAPPLMRRHPHYIRHPDVMCRTASAEVTASEVPAVQEKGVMGDGSLSAVTDMWQMCSEKYGDIVAVYDPHRNPPFSLTYRELVTQMECMAYALQSLGLRPGESVALFAESSPRWIVADQAVMMNAAVDAVRGSTAPLIELQQIVLNSGSIGLILHDKNVLEELVQAELTPVAGHPNGIEKQQRQFSEVMKNNIKFVVLLWGDTSSVTTTINFPVFTYDQLIALGRSHSTTAPLPKSKLEDIATLVYTSGTSGVPKGVELTHANVLYQIRSFKTILDLHAGDQILSLLPPWHIYERATAYYVFDCGCRVVYSGVKVFKDDLVKYPSDAFITVPLVLDTLYKKVMKRLQKASWLRRLVGLGLLKASMTYIAARRVVNGVDLRFACKARPRTELLKAVFLSWILTPLQWLARILVHRPIKQAVGIQGVVASGGGSLARHLDLFFEAIGLTVLNGWGMTETSPVLSCRLPHGHQNVRGTVGFPIPETELKVVDPESPQEVEDGTAGLILARGPGVMKGYRKNPEETDRVMLGDGWLSTGDRGWKAPAGVKGSLMEGNVVLTGRVKDTIVLSNGKNIEPQPIEDWLQVSPMISHIMVIGQDRRSLGALVVPDDEIFSGMEREAIEKQVLDEIWKIEQQNPSFVQHMHIAAIRVLDDPFSVDNGALTKTMKIKRSMIMEKYADDVQLLEKRIR